MTAQNSVRSYVGIAKETTKGTAVAPTSFIPVAVGKLKPVDVIDPLFDTGLRGSMAKNYNYVQGRVRSTFDFGGPVFPDTFPWAVSGLLGSVATTGASAPFTHTVSLKNAATTAADAQPTAFTLTDFYAASVRAFSGCQVHDVSLTFSAEGLLEYDAKATGWQSATASTPTPTFSTITPTPVWQATVTIGGTTITNAVEGSLNMSRPVKPIYGINNTQNPFAIFVAELDVKGQLKFVMEADTELTRYLTNTQPSIVINWAQGSGATATQIQATLSKGAYTAAMVERGKEYVEVQVSIDSIANTTDAGSSAGYSPIKWVFQNAIASGTYQ